MNEKDVYRFEYELKNDFLKHIKGFDWKHIFTPEGQFELLDIARKSHFAFVIENGLSRNDRKESFELFDWSSLRDLPEFIFDYSWKRKLPVGHSVRSIQVMIGSLLKHYVINKQPPETLNQIRQIIEIYDLRDWFNDKVESYLTRYLKLRKQNYEFKIEKLIY